MKIENLCDVIEMSQLSESYLAHLASASEHLMQPLAPLAQVERAHAQTPNSAPCLNCYLSALYFRGPPPTGHAVAGLSSLCTRESLDNENERK